MKNIGSIILIIFSSFLLPQDIDPDLAKLAASNPEFLESLNTDGIIKKEILKEDISVDSQLLDETVPSDFAIKKFGFDFIKTVPKSISSTSDLPVPNDYLLSLGDTLKIILTGNEKQIYELEVGLDGAILFPELGSLNVFGESIKDVRDKIQKLISISYVGTEVAVSLGKLSAKKINIIGAVRNPGTYIVNPFSTITSALAYSGGFLEYASLRKIVLIREGVQIEFDLYDLLIFGNRNKDINIQQGDTIIVNSTTDFIAIEGSVNRPHVYEFKTNENISDIIKFAMGFSQFANNQNIALTYLNKNLEASEIIEVDLNEDKKLSSFNMPLKIEVFKISSSENVSIRVTGPLENQGYFRVPESGMLFDVIKELKFTDNVYPYIAVLQDNNRSEVFSLVDETTQNLKISTNTHLHFFNKYDDTLTNLIIDHLNGSDLSKSFLTANTLDLISDYKLKIDFDGRQIYFPFYGQLSAKDITDYLGLDLSSTDLSETTYIAPLNEKVLVGNIEDMVLTASKYNYLTLRSLTDQTITVTVVGEANLPGSYTLLSGTSLSELYERMGGIKPSADTNAVIFTRESIKEDNIKNLRNAQNALRETLIINNETIDPSFLFMLNEDIDEDSLGRISGDLTYGSEGLEDFFLEDGDVLYIPKKIYTVSVIGEVLNPSSFIYKKDMTFKSLVNESGGFSQTALKNKPYVIRANGKVERISGIFNNNIKIRPGDTIVVPKNFNANQDLVSIITPITSILSNLAFSAAAIDNLKR